MPPCPDAVLPSHDPTPAAAWMWLALIVAVVVFELWAWRTRHPTLSQFVQRKPRWFRWLAEVGIVVLGAHLFGLF